MKVLVTGGAGYIGSHTCRHLAESGHEVIVYDNLGTGHASFARWGEFAEGDINDNARLRSCMRKFRPDAVIHFAAWSQVGESMRSPGKYYHNNIGGTLSLLEAMREEGITTIVVSGSAAVYGHVDVTPIPETVPGIPINPYGTTKLVMEKILADFARAYGLNWIALRYFNAAGCSPDGVIGELHNPETHLIPRIFMSALSLAPAMEIYGTDYPTPDGTCIRDYIHVDDLASAHMLAATSLLDGGESGPMNLGTGQGSSVLEVLEGAREVSGLPIPAIERQRRPGDPSILVADATKARECLGWKPRYRLRDMLQHSWEFMQKHQDFYKHG